MAAIALFAPVLSGTVTLMLVVVRLDFLSFNSLEAKGWSVFWDEEVPTGEKWRDHIFENLETSRCVIVAWSAESVDRDWVREEAEYAKQRSVLLPVLIDPIRLPFGFAEVQAIDLTGWDGSEHDDSFQRLVREIARIIGTPPEAIEPEIETAPTKKTEHRKVLSGVIALLSVGVTVFFLWPYFQSDEDPSPPVSPPADPIAEPPGQEFLRSIRKWGIAYGAEKNQDSAMWEATITAEKLGYKNTALFFRKGWYHSVATTNERPQAEQYPAKAPEGSTIVEMSSWYPDPSLMVAPKENAIEKHAALFRFRFMLGLGAGIGIP